MLVCAVITPLPGPGCVVGELFAGRYELVDPLGQGGTGWVWRAWDHRGGCFLAAKVLRQSDAGSLLRFVREQSLRFEHPHVVKPIGWAGEDDRVLLTMPLIRGGSVAALLRDFPTLPVRWAALLLDQLLDALTAVHTAGVVHRDVKPANLLLEPTGTARPQLRLSDFGTAVAVSEPRLTHVSTVYGTPGYISPEQLAGADPHPTTDLYAAGVVTVELLTGERPRPGGWPVLSGRRPAGQPEKLWALLKRLAAPDPVDRPASAQQARAQLAATGLLPPPGKAPDDGAAIEISDRMPELPEAWHEPPTRRIGPPVTAGHQPAPPDLRPAAVTVPLFTTSTLAPEPPAPRPALPRRWRIGLYGLAGAALLGGVALLVAAVAVVLG
jgi:serine/threonine-protein kinase